MKPLLVAALGFALATSLTAYAQYTRAEAAAALSTSYASSLADTDKRLQDSTGRLQTVQGELAARQFDLTETQGKLRDANTALETTRSSLQETTSRNTSLTQQLDSLSKTAAATNRNGTPPAPSNTVACAYADTQGFGVIYTIEFLPEMAATMLKNGSFCNNTSDMKDKIVELITVSDFQTRTKGLQPVCDVPFPYLGSTRSRVYSVNDPFSTFAADGVCKYQLQAAAKKPQP